MCRSRSRDQAVEIPDILRLDELDGDPAVADAIKGLAGKYSSVLLANHGPVVSGDTLEAAVFAIEELEETAKLYLLLRGLNPRYLSPEQVKDLTDVFGLALPEHGHD